MKAARKKNRRFPPRSQRSALGEGPLERVRLTLTEFGDHGEALGYADDGRVVRAAYGVPGEEVIVEVREDHESYLIGEVVEILTFAPERVQPKCPHFGVCGGCQLQHIDYSHQTELKKRVVENQLRRVGKFMAPPVSPMIPAKDPWHYRNNARFTVRLQGTPGFTNWYTHRFEPIDSCYIMDTRINDAKTALNGALAPKERQLAVRVGRNTDSYLIHPNLGKRGSEAGLETGQLGHEERIFGFPFRVSAASFFQVNTQQAERMVALVRERLRLKGNEVLLDAYAGVGTFAALLAPFCARVIAIEESASAVQDAHENLAAFPNIQIVEAKTEEALSEMETHPDVVILDPPRSGCDSRVLRALGRLKPERIVYVSCDPETLARDLHDLVLAGFRLTDVTPVDMFPQTYHIECVATLERAAPGTFVLASSSPRRRELIDRLGLPVQILAPTSGEEPPPPEPGDDVTPADYVVSLAKAKALSLAERSQVPVLGADTVVVGPDGRILGKPTDVDDARAMLRYLRGREHTVITGVAVAAPGGTDVFADFSETQGRMRDYTDEEIEAYIATGDPLDKAGAYGIQNRVFHPVEEVRGCGLNVVGLPLCLVDRLLREAGVFIPGPAASSVTADRCAFCADRTPSWLRLP